MCQSSGLPPTVPSGLRPDGRTFLESRKRWCDMKAVQMMAVAAVFLFAIPQSGWTASIWSPQRGTIERKMILDAARPAMQREIGGEIEFVVSVIRTDGRWSFVQAVPQRPGGGRIDWAHTKFANEWRNDMMSDIVMALLRKSGTRWQVVDFVIGPTDVFWVSWVSQYRLPEALFNAE